MKPKRRPYSGKIKIVRKEMPRFIKFGSIALKRELIKHISTIKAVDSRQTMLFLKIPRLFSYEEKNVTLPIEYSEVVEILNQY